MMNRRELIKNIYEILEEEVKNNPVSYNKEKPYQAYERIGLKGLRWSVEKRISEYKLQRFFDKIRNRKMISRISLFFTFHLLSSFMYSTPYFWKVERKNGGV